MKRSFKSASFGSQDLVLWALSWEGRTADRGMGDMKARGTSMDKIKPLLQELKGELSKIYGPRLKQLILYGSYARGDAETGSDLDFMVVLDELEDPLAEREGLSELISKLSLQYSVVLSVLPVAEQALHEGQKPLFLNVKREGVPV